MYYLSMNHNEKLAHLGGIWKNRQSINIINIVITSIVLFMAIQVSDSGLVTNLKTITENLNRAFSEIIYNGNLYYTDLDDSNITYESSNVVFSPKGMAGLYDLTNAFLKSVLKEDIDVSDIIKVENGEIQYQSGNEMNFISSFAGVITILIITLIFLIFIPLVGICFCCCRCRGKCGAKSKPFNKKKDFRKKVCQATFLFILAALLLFCVVCAFGSNEQFHDGLNDFTGDAKGGVRDTSLYLDTINKQMEHLLVNNYNEFTETLLTTIDSSVATLTNELDEITNLEIVSEISDISSTNVPEINKAISDLKSESEIIHQKGSQLNDAVDEIKTDLSNTIQQCAALSVQECTDFDEEISSLPTIDLDNVPDIPEELNNMNLDNLQQIGTDGKNVIENVKNDINNKIQNSLKTAKDTINDAGEEIKKNLNDVQKAVKDFDKTIQDKTEEPINDIDDYIDQYAKYWYIGCIFLSIILLLITVSIALGLVFGICCKAPNNNKDNRCNKGTGSQFLICAVMLMFIASFVFGILSIFAFTFGLFSERLVCYPIRNPNDSSVLNLVDAAFDFKDLADVDVTLKQLLQNCYQNESAYNVFNLKSKFDLDEAIQNFDIDQVLSTIKTIMDQIGTITILDSDNEKKLDELMELSPENDLTTFKDKLTDNFKGFSFTEFQEKLENLIETLKENPALLNIVENLKDILKRIDDLNTNLVEPVKEIAVVTIPSIIDNLIQSLDFGSGSFSESISHIKTELNDTENSLNTDARETLQKILDDFTQNVGNQIKSYTDRIVDQTKNNIGKCGPLSQVIDATLTTTCDKILTPLTGFWFSLFASLILFVPTLILSINLANLYKNFKPTDIYGDIYINGRDRRKDEQHNRYEERVGVESNNVQSDYTNGFNPYSNPRYQDMAPKQRFPAGGQYLREYQRSPPYYSGYS